MSSITSAGIPTPLLIRRRCQTGFTARVCTAHLLSPEVEACGRTQVHHQRLAVVNSAPERPFESTTSRRFFSLATAAVFQSVALQACADEAELVQFYGAANPPATYGGVGGTTRDKARYGFKVPSSFKEEAVSKVEKGSAGIDCRFATGARKKQSVFVVSLRNEGSRDGSGFTLASDPSVALQSVAGSSTELQDAISAGTVTSARRGDSFIYELTGPTCGAFAVTTKQGRLFGIFVLSSAATWETNKDSLVGIRDSFQVFDAIE